MMDAFRIVPAGDSAVIVEFDARIDAVVNAKVIAVAEALEAALPVGVRDVVPTYRSVAIYFDPLTTDVDALTEHVERVIGELRPRRAAGRPPVRIPVCYGGEFGPDLPAVAAFAHLTVAEVIRVHSAKAYRVFMLGFVPGFAYLGVVDDAIAMPRHATPRVRVPVGSVGLAGVQTGVYPADTPGGWQLIGRTPVRPFDPGRAQPSLLKAGDTVEFYPVEREEFDRLRGGGA